MDKEKITRLASEVGLNITIYTEDMYKPINNSQKDEYNVEDCIIIRTTDVFPKDKIVQTPINGNAFFLKENSVFGDILKKLINQKYSHVEDWIEKTELVNEELDLYDIYCKLPRSTIHFTVNGLVSNHAYGNFSNKPYIILEPLKYHINDKGLIGLRVEDTYFNEDMNLSEEAIIIITQEDFEKNIRYPNFVETLKKFKVVVYNGEEERVVATVLNSLGYDAFLTNDHGYVSGTQEQKMINFVYDLAKSRGISIERHYYSEARVQDNEVLIEKMTETENAYLKFVLDYADIPAELRDEIITSKEGGFSYDYKIFIEKLVELIGLDNLKLLTQRYNEECIKANYSKQENSIKK